MARREGLADPESFRRHLVIQTDQGPRRYWKARKAWQEERVFKPMDEAARQLAGVSDRAPSEASWWHAVVGPRGISKTSGLAWTALYGVAQGGRAVRGVVAAGDRDQAALLRKAAEVAAQLNPWLRACVEVQRWVLRNPRTGSEAEIVSADAVTSYGHLVDFVVADEWTLWPRRDLWDSLFSAATKRRRCLFVAISNAGRGPGWARDMRDALAADEAVRFWQPDGRALETWLAPEDVETARRVLPAAVFARLYENVWSGEVGDFVSADQALACRDAALSRHDHGLPGVRYVASIDYGITKDRCVATVVHHDGERVAVDAMDVWQGSPDAPILVATVEDWMEKTAAAFPGVTFVVDPWEMRGTIQKYGRRFTVEPFQSRGGANNYRLATNLRNLISNRRVAWYPDCGGLDTPQEHQDVETEVARLVCRETSYGWRLDHKSTEHDDRAVALGMAALKAVDLGPAPRPMFIVRQPPRGREGELFL